MNTVKSKNLDYQHFMAYTNIIREFRALSMYDPTELFKMYNEYIVRSDEYRLNPSAHNGFKEIIGYRMSDISQLSKKQGLAFILLHYGAYRHSLITVLEHLINKGNANKSVYIVVDQKSFDSEQKLKWKGIFSSLNCTFLVAENSMTALILMRHIQSGGIVILYLDGMTGFGKDKSPINLPFISSHVRFRSGFFRLLSKVRIPVFGVVSTNEDNSLIVSPPIDPKDAVGTASTLMSFFRSILLQDPSKWRLWYRHHQFVETIPIFKENEYEGRNITRLICHDVKPKLILEEETGDVYPWLD